MMLRPGVRRWFRLRPREEVSVRQQVEEEIALHIELRARDLMARGTSEHTAYMEAERRFGELERARLLLRHAATERERTMSIREWLSGWGQDFRYSLRSLGRERLPATVIVLTLALGLGANTIMFGIVDHLLLRGPAHVVDADNVRRLYVTERSMFGGEVETTAGTGYVAYAVLRDEVSLLEHAAAYYHRPTGRIGRGEHARQVTIGWSTADLFPLLGVTPHIGRFYTEEEDRPRDPSQVAVLDHGLWVSEYGGSDEVLGRTITVNDGEYTVIGVTPPGFTGPELEPVSLWLPLSTGFKPHPEWPTTWDARWLSVVARLSPGVTADAAAAEATQAYRAAAEGHRASSAEGTVSLLPLHYGPRGEVPAEAAVARWLLGVSVIVLLIAAANVMNLLLARVLRRRREVSVRLTLGISRGRLARLLLSESLLLTMAGLAGALALARWAGEFVRLALLPNVQWGAPLGPRSLLFAGAAALLTGLLIGLAPVLQTGRGDLSAGLRSGSAGSTGGAGRARGMLTVAQAALSVVLLVGAGLFVRSLWNVSRVDLGIDADRLLAVWVDFAAQPEGTADEGRAAQAERRTAFYREAVAHLRAQPGIESAALAMGMPLQGGLGVPLTVPGRDSIPQLPGGGPWITVVSPSYFETTGTHIVQGRGFRDGEGAGSEPVTVVSETFARAVWPGEDPLTKCVIVGNEDESGPAVFTGSSCAQVIGVARDANRAGVRQQPVLQYYVPIGQERGVAGTQIVVRPRGDALAAIPELRRTLHALHPGISWLTINPLRAPIERQVRPWRLGATMFLVFGSLALLIAAVGLYSVIAYGVAQRRTEIGVRMALGARTHTIVGMIVGQGVGLVLIGTTIGAALALAAGPRLEPLLFDIAGRDTLTVATVCAVLLAVAVLACALPAMHAGRTNPVEALRTD